MTEKEFRIKCLREKMNLNVDAKIALYGSGKNSEAIIETFKENQIIAIIDREGIGKYKYGKKIISLDDASYLNLDMIIIAAETITESIIVKRVIHWCLQFNVKLINMYGIDVIEKYEKHLMDDINYINLKETHLRCDIESCEVVCFELMGILCESRYFSTQSLFERIEKEILVSGFCKNRISAEEQRNIYRKRDINDIYDIYMVNTYSEMEDVRQIQKREEELFLDSIVPKEKMLLLVQYACNMGKRVYVISDLPYSSYVLDGIKEKINLREFENVIQENRYNQTYSGGLLRTALQNDFDKQVLYIGQKDSMGCRLADDYGFKVCILKSSWEYMQDISDISLKHVKKDNLIDCMKEWCVKEFNSPFHEDYFEQKIEGIVDQYLDEDSEKEQLDLIPFNSSQEIHSFAKLNFPQFSNIEVSIIIPVYNHFDYTYACLCSVLRNTLKVKYEVILADDCSTDITARVLEIVDGIHVIKNEENLLFLKNCNHAAKNAKGKYLLFLNNDTQVQYNWLYPLVHLMETDESVGMTGSKLIFPDGTVQEAGGIIWNDGSGANYGRGKSRKKSELNYVREVDYISGASILVRKSLWDEIGGFDERFSPAYYEDADFAFEVRNHGKKVVYQPASEVIHFEGISNGKSVKEGIKKYQEKNLVKFIEKWQKEMKGQYSNSSHMLFAAKERKKNRKTVLVISVIVPTYDKDAGSKAVMRYISLFLKKGYIVKFWAINLYPSQPYTLELQQMGVEVIYGKGMKEKMSNWIIQNQNDIEYAFVNYPDAAKEVIDLLNLTSIKVRYYGHDLHYLRLLREYMVNQNEETLKKSKKYLEIEKNLIEKAECVYYPSEVEIDIVKQKFHKENAKQIMLYMFDSVDDYLYNPNEREGIMFIGGSHGPNEDAIFWFLTEVYPLIYNKKKIPFYIVGANQSVKLRNINIEGVVNVGYVTDDELDDIYHKIKMVVIPLRYGAGIKGKVVDAMYHGVPIVSTSIGIEGIPDANACCAIADDEKVFSDYVLDLYEDKKSLLEMSQHSQDIIKKYFSVDVAWNKIANDFE